eukprot:13031_1
MGHEHSKKSVSDITVNKVGTSNVNIPTICVNGKQRQSYLTQYKGQTPALNKSLFNNIISEKPFSDRLAQSAANFWSIIETLSMEDRLEIGVYVLTEMISISDENLRIILKSYFLTSTDKKETHSLKLLDMVGFIVRSISHDNANIVSLLSRLGLYHKQIGIKTNHFMPLLNALHKAFEHYFPAAYNADIKFAFDEVFKWTSEKMMKNQIINYTELLDLSFLKSFGLCLESNIGRNYLCSFLVSQWCDEQSVFLLLLYQFKHETTSAIRFKIAKRIVELCIENEGIYVINIPYEIRNNVLEKMACKKCKRAKVNFFDEVEQDMCRSIKANHWFKFVYYIKSIDRSSTRA